MQAVSTAFKNAALAATMTPVRSATIQLVDNQSIGAVLTPTAAESDSTYFPASQAVDGITVLGAKWAFADPFAEGAGGRFLADGTLYPIASPWEGGWQGVTLSDNSGNIAGGEALVITYGSPVSIATLQFWADSFLGYPVDFVIAYDPTGSAGYTTIVTVTGNTQTQYVYQIGSTLTVKKLRITITKINYGQQPARLIELQGGLLIDVSASVATQDVLQERFPDQASIPVGNSSAGQLTLSQDNTSGNWSPHRSASIYAANLRANRKIRVRVGFQFSNGATELIPLGTYYSRRWSAPGGEPLATVSGQDRMKKLRETQYRKCVLQINKTVDQCIQQALLDFGLGINEFVLAASSNVIPYAFAQPTQTFFDYIQKLAAVDGGVAYFDENDIFRFQDANYLHNNSLTSLLTLTDASGAISASDEWSDGEVRNRIVVNVNSLKLAASAVIWTLQETLSVPANPTPGGVTNTAATGSFVAVGNNGTAERWEAQSFQVTAGQLSQFTFGLSANTGAPVGTITWDIRTDNAGQPSASILATGTIAPTPSATNTVNIVSGPTLSSGTTYWLVLHCTAAQAVGVFYGWTRQVGGSYALGFLSQSSDAGVTWLATADDAQCTITTSVIGAGTLTINAALQSPAINITTPSFSAGAGVSLSSWTAYAYNVVLVFANSSGSPVNVTACTISGQELKADGQALAIAETASVTANLEAPREQNFNNPYVQASSVANTLAANLLANYSNPPAKLHIETVGLPHLELGDRVTVNSSQLGINSDFWVIRHQFVDDGSFHSSLDLYAVV